MGDTDQQGPKGDPGIKGGKGDKGPQGLSGTAQIPVRPHRASAAPRWSLRISARLGQTATGGGCDISGTDFSKDAVFSRDGVANSGNRVLG